MGTTAATSVHHATYLLLLSTLLFFQHNTLYLIIIIILYNYGIHLSSDQFSMSVRQVSKHDQGILKALPRRAIFLASFTFMYAPIIPGRKSGAIAGLLLGIAWGWSISRFRFDTRWDIVQIPSRVMNLSTGWVQSLSRMSMAIIRDYSEVHSSAARHSHCEWCAESPGHMTARHNSHWNRTITSNSEILCHFDGRSVTHCHVPECVLCHCSYTLQTSHKAAHFDHFLTW